MRLNNQVPEPAVRDALPGDPLAVNSIFHTIQGEGPFAGTPAIFIRLAGCNLQCPLCDTEYTKRTLLTVEGIRDAMLDARSLPATSDIKPADLVVITGGEPFRQPIGRLVSALLRDGYRVQIETNGTLPPDEDFPIMRGRWGGYSGEAGQRVWIVCSPKAGGVHKRLLPHIDAFKYVATVESLKGSPDGLPLRALDHPAAPMLYRKPVEHDAEVYLQPVDEGNDYPNHLNRRAVVESCLKHGYRLCLQIHKQIGVP